MTAALVVVGLYVGAALICWQMVRRADQDAQRRRMERRHLLAEMSPAERERLAWLYLEAARLRQRQRVEAGRRRPREVPPVEPVLDEIRTLVGKAAR